jgi:hypothetical protein
VGVTFPLKAVSTTVAARVETWTRLQMHWRTRPIQPNHGKPTVSVEIESSAWLAEVMIWVSGEAELATTGLSTNTMNSTMGHTGGPASGRPG